VLLFGTLSLLRRMDHAWVLVRRAAGHDQRSGVLGRVFAITAVVCAAIFLLWFVLLHGPGTSLVSKGEGA
jgi:predicted secreted protein